LGVVRGEPDAHADRTGRQLDAREILADLAREDLRPRDVRRGQDREELLAADAGGQVHAPRVALENRRHHAQRAVTRGVAEAVVVLLEPVDVEQYDDERTAALRRRELRLERQPRPTP